MKKVIYESSPGALAAYLASKPAAAMPVDLYTVTFAGNVNGGQPLYFTTADVDVVVPYTSGAITYSSKSLYLDQLNNKAYGHWKVGLDVDTWQVICTPNSTLTIGGANFLSALRAGVLDGATVQVARGYVDIRSGAPGAVQSLTPLGVIIVFFGRIAEIDIGRSNAVLTLNSHLELLNVALPKNLFQAGCRWVVYSPGCTLSRASFAKAGTIAANTSTNAPTVTVASPGGSGTFALGYIEMTSGKNEGFTRLIRSWTAGSPATFNLISPFPFPLTAGDTFNAYPGCDRQYNTCQAFNNTTNFGGAPFIPAPETTT